MGIDRAVIMIGVLALALVVLVATEVAVLQPNVGSTSPMRTATTSAVQCDFGYYLSTNSKAESCAPSRFTVREGQSLSTIAGVFGDATRVNELCVGEETGDVLVLDPPGNFDPRNIQPGKIVTLCV